LRDLRPGVRIRMELASADLLSLYRRRRHRWIVRPGSDVYRRDCAHRMARAPGRILSGQYRRGNSACLRLQLFDRNDAPWRLRMALAARNFSASRALFPACAVWHSTQPTLAFHEDEARRGAAVA